MTETSGESGAWLWPSTGFPSSGAWSLALKLHQALTTGRESAWLYWQLAEDKPAGNETLTDATALATAPKLAAVKHFFRHIRPGAQRVAATVGGSTTLLASAYLHERNGTLTLVLVNAAAPAATATVTLPPIPTGVGSADAWTSHSGSLWSHAALAATSGQLSVQVPGYGVVTLLAAGTPAPGDGGSGGDGGLTGDGGTPEDAGSAADGGMPGDAGSGGRSDGGPITGAAGGCGCSGGPAGCFLLALLAASLATRRRGAR